MRRTDEVDPRVERALDRAEDALDRGDAESAIDLAEEVLAAHRDHPGALFVAAEAYRDLRYLEEAEERYLRVTQVNPDHSPSWSGLGACRFDQVRIDDSVAPLLKAIRLDPTNPEPYYWRGMIRERRGDLRGARRDFRRAWRLDPAAYPMPQRLEDAEIDAIVGEVVASLHPTIQTYLLQVAILLEEVPDEEVLLQFDPPMPPGEILGLYTGAPLTERSLENPWSHLPSAIVLYRHNLERIASDRQRILEELRITVFHEVGHHLGLDEDDLERRGLD